MKGFTFQLVDAGTRTPIGVFNAWEGQILAPGDWIEGAQRSWRVRDIYVPCGDRRYDATAIVEPVITRRRA